MATSRGLVAIKPPAQHCEIGRAVSIEIELEGRALDVVEPAQLTVIEVLKSCDIITPVPPPPGLSAGSDFPYLPLGPALHLGAYGVLASLLALSTWATRPRIALLPVSLAASFVAATAYGAALELYQTTLSTRAGSWGDATLNAAGAALALVVLAWLHRWRGSAARP